MSTVRCVVRMRWKQARRRRRHSMCRGRTFLKDGGRRCRRRRGFRAWGWGRRRRGRRAEAQVTIVSLKVNGQAHDVELDSRTSLLDALREKLSLTGEQEGLRPRAVWGLYGVLVDGRRVNSCLTLAVAAEGSEITTIEGLAKGEELHAMQASFVDHDGFQCGYCTPGQICSAGGAGGRGEEGAVVGGEL